MMPIDQNGPKKEVGPADEYGANHTKSSRRDAHNLISRSTSLRRRRESSRRLPVLESGYADPWRRSQSPVAGYSAAAEHLTELGLLPAPDTLALRDMYRRGGHHRRVAEHIATAWELVQ
jgi:hypothetical protein